MLSSYVRSRGFTLVEFAIVMVLAALVLGGLLFPLVGQLESRRVRDAREKIEEIKEAVLGFAAAHGRLPCPASPTSNGRESFCENDSGACTPIAEVRAHGRCSDSFNGFVPAATLGLSPTDASGYALDPWETQSSRWRYAVTDSTAASVAFALTAANGIRTATATYIAQTPMLAVCARGGIADNAADCPAAGTLAERTPVVIWTIGRNLSAAGVSTDEQENGDGDRFFVSHDITDAGAPSGEFDDVVGWLSLPLLVSKMLSAGQL